MIINIVCHDKGWIYDRFIGKFIKHSRHTIVRNSNSKFDLAHYIPYYEAPKKVYHPSTAWMSHRESKKDLRIKFDSVAKIVDVPISHSKKYADMLSDHGAVQIMPGVDLDEFKILKKRNSGDKLVVGYIGRQYTSSARKNPSLLDKISKLDFVDFRATGGNIDEKDMPRFYSNLDLAVSPATIEGGPMTLNEAAACGIKVLCFEGVGASSEFPKNTITVPYGDSEAFINEIKDIWSSKRYIGWEDMTIRELMRKDVECLTWKLFVEKHDDVWDRLL